jgi:hypothetical protein
MADSSGQEKYEPTYGLINICSASPVNGLATFFGSFAREAFAGRGKCTSKMRGGIGSIRHLP